MSFTLTIDSVDYSHIARSLNISDTLDQRSTATFALYDNLNAYSFTNGQKGGHH